MARLKVTKGRVLCKVASSTLGKAAPRFLRNVRHLERSKGPEFVVKRLKAIQSSSLQARSGNLTLASQILSDARIAVRKDKPFIPRGVEGIISMNIIEAKRNSVLRKNLMLTRCYTGFYLKQPSKEQFNKSKRNITSKGVSQIDRELHLIYLDLCGKLPHIPIEKLKRGYLEDMSGSSRYPSLDKLSNKDLALPYASMCSSLITKGRVPQPLIDHFGDSTMRYLSAIHQELEGDTSFGKISFLQEGGCKGRVVCQPNAWLQFYFQPLHKSLLGTLITLEQDGGLDKLEYHGTSTVLGQTKGAWIMKRWMETGKPVTAIDLSSATDRYPLGLQTELLEKIGYNIYSQSLREVAKGPFIVRTKVSGRKPVNQKWSYEKGQPMGLYGSFVLFHLSHLLLLEACSRKVGLTTNDNYCVLGDDVLISDDRLKKEYLNAITMLGIETSSAKSFSGKVSEFAGFLCIDKGSPSVTVFRPFKWGNGFSTDDKELHVMASLGREVVGLGTHWKKSLEIFEKTLPYRDLDLTPLVTSEKPLGHFNKVGSRWFESILDRIQKEVMVAGEIPYSIARPMSFISKSTWRKDSSMFLSENIETPGLSRSFDPEQYLRDDRRRKRFTNFLSTDPLMVSARKLCEENTLSNQLPLIGEPIKTERVVTRRLKR